MLDQYGDVIWIPDPEGTSWEKQPETTGYGAKDVETITTDKSKSWRLEDEGENTTYSKSKPFVGSSFDSIRGGNIQFNLLNDVVDLELVLNILHTQAEAKLLANPRVLVLDNETAKFEIVREIPYEERSEGGGGDRTLTTIKFKPVGVKLNVTPHVTRDGMIKLHIAPEFGIVVSLGAYGAPTIDTRTG